MTDLNTPLRIHEETECPVINVYDKDMVFIFRAECGNTDNLEKFKEIFRRANAYDEAELNSAIKDLYARDVKSTLFTLERIMDVLTGDQCAELGIYSLKTELEESLISCGDTIKLTNEEGVYV